MVNITGTAPSAVGLHQGSLLAGALCAVLMVAGCDVLPSGVKGDVSGNIPPIVEFANVPAHGDTFSYAPVIYWKGRDPDGFVEHYLYADIIDSTALGDPDYYIDFIPGESWVETEACSDTIYLLTETGVVTEHVFYLKCVDDREAESDVIYRTFYRTNQPPKVPFIKWYNEPDSTFGHDIPLPGMLHTILNDTLYCLDNITGTWPGLGFNWKSNDPDDTELITIPLQYRYYLEKVPHDTLWQWVAPDWTSRQEIRIHGLQTGHYLFTVWTRDDGFESCARPASATFDVYRPTFEQSILLLNTTDMNTPGATGEWNLVPGEPIAELYRSMVSQYPDADYYYYTGGGRLWKTFLGRYRLVIWFSESQRHTANDTLELDLRDYIRIGGRLWVNGIIIRRNMISNTTLQLAESSFGGPAAGAYIGRGSVAEFTGAISASPQGGEGLPELFIDTTRTGAIYRRFFVSPVDSTQLLPGVKVYPLLPGIDIITAGTGAETVYYFNSYTDTASGDVSGELAEVRADVDTIYYPPTAVDCIIALNRNRVSEITRVENITRRQMGTPVILTNNVTVAGERVCVARVSYGYGEPWALTDSVMVDYHYYPYSELHMKPVAIRYELLTFSGQAYEVGYRVAVFTFPLYYLDNRNGAVTRMFQSMLRWFFFPAAHS